MHSKAAAGRTCCLHSLLNRRGGGGSCLGAYIMLVEEVRISYTRPLDEVRDEIERDLRGRERARLMKNWVDKLKAKNFVRYF